MRDGIRLIGRTLKVEGSMYQEGEHENYPKAGPGERLTVRVRGELELR